MAVAETDDPAEDGRRGDAARVVEAHVEPQRGHLVFAEKVVTHHGRQLGEDAPEGGRLALLPVRVALSLDLPRAEAAARFLGLQLLLSLEVS